jgi:Flp pilus assembly protein TadG
MAAPGLGAMVGSLGVMFALLPPLLMLMMFTWMLSTFMRLLGE